VFLEREMEKNLFEYFLDIGANSGYYSFFFANKFKNLKVKAYEPNFDAFNKFKKTLNKNSFKILRFLILDYQIRKKK
jgi:FkbM family methyltransferase